MPDIAPLLLRGRILTMDSGRPEVRSLLARDGRILALDAEAEAIAAGSPVVREVELRPPQVALPGFIDAHVHLLAAAARKRSLDCSPASVGSIRDLQEAIRRLARETPPGRWLRAGGYDEMALDEGRHPNRQDLDVAAPDHPVRLIHRGGHASVLNSLALRLAGIDTFTPEPPGGYMERDLATGEPTGLLIEMDELIEAAVPPLPEDELAAAVTELNADLMAAGVTCIADATAHNGPDEWALVERFMRQGRLQVAVSLMESVHGIESVALEAPGGRLRRGAVKVVPKELEHEVHPLAPELAAILQRIDDAGRQAAVHAVGRVGIDATLEAYASLGKRGSLPHRIEHASVCGHATASRIAELGLAVVTQPGFIYWNGDSYLKRVPPSDRPHLYALRTLMDAGILVAGSTDAPVSPPDVLTAIAAAVTRRTRLGATVAPAEAISPREAFALYTSSAARVLGLEEERGMLRPGLAADIVVLSDDPFAPATDLSSVRVLSTLIAGDPVWTAA
jgi:predicted amidohydrolase YtcJ